MVHQPAYLSIWPAAPSLQWGLSTNPGVTVWCVCGCSRRDGVCRCCRGDSGDGCDLASTLCKYDFRKGYLFVLSWARVRRVRRGSLSSELLMCGRSMRRILSLPLVARCLETIDVYSMYMAHVCFYVCCSDCVGVSGNVCCVVTVVKNSFFFLGVLKYVVFCVVDVMDVVFSVCNVRRGAVGARIWEVWVFRHGYAVCLCLVCILWQFSMLRSAWLAVC